MKKAPEIKQLPLTFTTPTYMGRDDFMVSECNKQAFQMIETWPNWLGSGLIIYGPAGCGKSHLAHLFAERAATAYSTPLRIPFINARDVTIARAKKLFTESPCAVVENIDTDCNEEALFHLFNLYNQNGYYILWTSACTPRHIHFKLKDLQSRFTLLPCIEIKEPDDFMLSMLIVKQCNDRQLSVSQDIINYIINNAQRSYAYIRELVKELDYLSLSWQKPVSHVMVKTAMANLDLQKNIQPDFFYDD